MTKGGFFDEVKVGFWIGRWDGCLNNNIDQSAMMQPIAMPIVLKLLRGVGM
jgi:hypothetical protein